MEEIERETVAREQAIANLYVRENGREFNSTQNQNKEISAQEFSNEIKNIREYRSMICIKNSIEDYDKEATILEMKLKLEHMKKTIGKIPKEQADTNIATMEQKTI